MSTKIFGHCAITFVAQLVLLTFLVLALPFRCLSWEQVFQVKLVDVATLMHGIKGLLS